MKSLFLSILGLSIKSSYIILIIFAIRFLIKNTPKIYSYILMVIVFVRLALLKSIPSIYSLFNYVEKRDIVTNYENNIVGAVEVEQFNNGVDITEKIQKAEGVSNIAETSTIGIWDILAIVWIVGMVAILIYSIYSYIKLKRKLEFAILQKDNIYLCESIESPFVLGFIKPKIYFPVTLDLEENEYIKKNKKIHIKRYDYIIKPICFVILIVHWFNPLVWLSYYLLVKDMEMSCDEEVLNNFNGEIKENYSKNIVELAIEKNKYFLVPIAFSQSGVKERIKNILKYKKYPRIVGICFVVLLVIVGCTTLPSSKKETYAEPFNGKNHNFAYGDGTDKYSNNEYIKGRQKYREEYDKIIDDLYENRTKFEEINTEYSTVGKGKFENLKKLLFTPNKVTLSNMTTLVENDENIISLEYTLTDISKYLMPSYEGEYDEYYIALNSDFGKLVADTLFVTVDDIDKVIINYKYNDIVEKREFIPENTEIFENNVEEDSFVQYIDQINYIEQGGYIIEEQLIINDNNIKMNELEDTNYEIFRYFNFEDKLKEIENGFTSSSWEGSQLGIKTETVDGVNYKNFNELGYSSTTITKSGEEEEYLGTDIIMCKVVFTGKPEKYEYIKTICYPVDDITKENFEGFFGKGEYEKYKYNIKTRKEIEEEQKELIEHSRKYNKNK